MPLWDLIPEGTAELDESRRGTVKPLRTAWPKVHAVAKTRDTDDIRERFEDQSPVRSGILRG